MSDTLATDAVLDQPSDGQAGRANEPQAQGAPDGRPSDNGQAAKEQENIRNLQRIYDQKLAGMQQQLQQANAAYVQTKQQMQQMQVNAAPDDYAKLEIRLQQEMEARQQAEYILNQQYAAQAETNRRRDTLQGLANKYDVDVSALDKANDYDEAVELAIAARDRKRQNKQQHTEERREANRPDVGGGRTSSPKTRWEDEYDEAMKRKDSVTQQRLLREQNTRK